jgi:manganese/zinc/iron transport system permease protein
MPDFDYTLWTVIIGGSITGLLSGLLGVFALLRKQSLLGDTISHAALPGIAIAFLILQVKNPLWLIPGAMATGWLGTLFISWVKRNSRLKEDALMAVVLSAFFGFGLLLLSIIQHLPTANQAGLTKFLFGNAATMLRQDIVIMSFFAVFALIILLLFWKEFKLATFDEEFLKSTGFPVHTLDILLLSIIVIAITIGLQSVGVVLMSAMLVAPAAAARQWTDKLSVMAVLSALFGMTASIGGALLSSVIGKLPTGPTAVLLITAIVMFSILFADNRGLMWEKIRRYNNRNDIAIARLLEQMFFMTTQHKNKQHLHEIKMLQSLSHEKIDSYIQTMEKRGWIEVRNDNTLFFLTSEGYSQAEKNLNEVGWNGN